MPTRRDAWRSRLSQPDRGADHRRCADRQQPECRPRAGAVARVVEPSTMLPAIGGRTAPCGCLRVDAGGADSVRRGPGRATARRRCRADRWRRPNRPSGRRASPPNSQRAASRRRACRRRAGRSTGGRRRRVGEQQQAGEVEEDPDAAEQAEHDEGDAHRAVDRWPARGPSPAATPSTTRSSDRAQRWSWGGSASRSGRRKRCRLRLEVRHALHGTADGHVDAIGDHPG